MTRLNCWPISPQTLLNWASGKPIRPSSFPKIDHAMWWEAGSAARFATGQGPICPLPRPTPLQWLIFDLRTRRQMSYEAVADAAGVDSAGRRWLSSSTVHRLERVAQARAPSERTIVGLARGLGSSESVVRDAVARTVGLFEAQALDRDVKEIADRLADLPDSVRPHALGAVFDVLRRFGDVPANDQPQIDAAAEAATLYLAIADDSEVAEAFRVAEDPVPADEES